MGLAALAYRVYHQAPPTLRAEDLSTAYAENPAEADRTCQGRELTVSGAWQAIRPLADAPGLLLELKVGAGRRVSCHFADADPDHRREFERRFHGMDVVRVQGRCVGRDGDSVVLKECALLNGTGTKGPGGLEPPRPRTLLRSRRGGPAKDGELFTR